MTTIRIRSLLVTFAVLALVLAAAPAMAAPAAAPASGLAATPASTCGPTLPDLHLEGAEGTASPLLAPLPQALQPHCCSQQDVDACRSGCKDIAPGCKGQIGCRAGECVCTCSCP